MPCAWFECYALSKLGRCCYWYHVVPGNNSECVFEQHQKVILRGVVYDPHNMSVGLNGSVKWYRSRSLDLITNEDVTDEYDVDVTYSVYPVSHGDLAGLFKDTYILTIQKTSSSDNGYYWYRITDNESCSAPSPYVYVNVSVISTVSTENSSCPSVSYQECASVTICDTQSIITSSTTTLHSLHNLNHSSSIHLTSSAIVQASSQAKAGICMTKPDTEYPEFIACLGVTIPTAGFVLILTILFICCAGIYVCRRKKSKQKSELKHIFVSLNFDGIKNIDNLDLVFVTLKHDLNLNSH